MDARPGDDDAERTAAEHRPALASAPEAHLPRGLPGLTPGSHLLRRAGGSGEAGFTAHTAGAHGVGSSAARSGIEDPVPLAFFFVLFFFDRQEPCRRTERFAVVVDRKLAGVDRNTAAETLRLDHHRNGPSLVAVAEPDPAPA